MADSASLLGAAVLRATCLAKAPRRTVQAVAATFSESESMSDVAVGKRKTSADIAFGAASLLNRPQRDLRRPTEGFQALKTAVHGSHRKDRQLKTPSQPEAASVEKNDGCPSRTDPGSSLRVRTNSSTAQLSPGSGCCLFVIVLPAHNLTCYGSVKNRSLVCVRACTCQVIRFCLTRRKSQVCIIPETYSNYYGPYIKSFW